MSFNNRTLKIIVAVILFVISVVVLVWLVKDPLLEQAVTIERFEINSLGDPVAVDVESVPASGYLECSDTDLCSELQVVIYMQGEAASGRAETWQRSKASCSATHTGTQWQLGSHCVPLSKDYSKFYLVAVLAKEKDAQRLPDDIQAKDADQLREQVEKYSFLGKRESISPEQVVRREPSDLEISRFEINHLDPIPSEVTNVAVRGYLECSQTTPCADLQVVVYTRDTAFKQADKWQRSNVLCTTAHAGSQWELDSDCVTLPLESSEFYLVAVLVEENEAQRLPTELQAVDAHSLREKLTQYAYLGNKESVSPEQTVEREDRLRIIRFDVNPVPTLAAETLNVTLSGSLECSQSASCSDLPIMVYTWGITPERDDYWRRSMLTCPAIHQGSRWQLPERCVELAEGFTKFHLVAVLVEESKASRIPLSIQAGDAGELRSKLMNHSYLACEESISPEIVVVRETPRPPTPTDTPTAIFPPPLPHLLHRAIHPRRHTLAPRLPNYPHRYPLTHRHLLCNRLSHFGMCQA